MSLIEYSERSLVISNTVLVTCLSPFFAPRPLTPKPKSILMNLLQAQFLTQVMVYLQIIHPCFVPTAGNSRMNGFALHLKKCYDQAEADEGQHWYKKRKDIFQKALTEWNSDNSPMRNLKRRYSIEAKEINALTKESRKQKVESREQILAINKSPCHAVT